jgi:GPH family glycoside/pentoside/hexuronide:cation symporter
MFAAFVLSSILSQAVWVWVSAKLGKTSALISGLVLYIILLFVIYRALPSVNVTAIAGLFMLAGMTNGAYQQIPWAMYPDLMDIMRLKTGAAIEGAFSAFWLFGQKFANALAPSLLALILSTYGWRETTQGITEQLPEAINALHMSITIVPSAILAVAILGLVFVYLRSLAENDG